MVYTRKVNLTPWQLPLPRRSLRHARWSLKMHTSLGVRQATLQGTTMWSTNEKNMLLSIFAIRPARAMEELNVPTVVKTERLVRKC